MFDLDIHKFWLYLVDIYLVDIYICIFQFRVYRVSSGRKLSRKMRKFCVALCKLFLAEMNFTEASKNVAEFHDNLFHKKKNNTQEKILRKTF